MKPFQKLLFIYSLLILPLAFLFTAFFAPKPQNFFVLFLFSPLAFFVWARFLKKKGHKAFSGLNTALAVMAVLTMLISGGSVSYFYSKGTGETKTLTDYPQIESITAPESTSTDSEPVNKSTAQQLQEIKDELTLLRAEQRGLSQILGISTSPEDINAIISGFQNETGTSSQAKATGYITISDSKYSLVDVYEQAATSSKIMGQIEYGKNYPYYSKVGSWYEIKLPSDEKAYTNFAYLKEVQSQ